jgi:succinyl-diaminopimelate desuccinylase
MTPSFAEQSRDVAAMVEAQREDIVALCADLVAAPSVNPPGDTRQVADVVTRALAARGLLSRQEHTDPSMPSVIAELDSGRPGPHLILNVHLDTMPPGDESAWSQPVWELTRTGGRLYGLGMGNMKGAVAAMITAAALLAERSGQWTGRITFTAVSDEVVFGDNGAAYLLREHPQLYGDGLLCGEGPGFRRLAIGEKGVLWLRLSATGAAGHSSAVAAGGSATARIAAAVSAVDALTGTLGALPADLAEMAIPGTDVDPGLVLTANVGTLQGGSFIGQIATHATAEVDLRLPPGLHTTDAYALVRRAVDGIDSVEVAEIKGWDPNWTRPDAPLTLAWQRAATAICGAPSEYAIRLPASDASRWRRRGVPALCFGPQPTWSAGIDDYAEEDEVLRCASLYTLTALSVLTPAPSTAAR